MRTRDLVCLFLLSSVPAGAADAGGQHDFDFDFGTWKTHVSRLAHPLSGSKEWIELDGTSVVRPIMDGRANLVELDIAGPSARITGVSLRLYDPETQQWSLNYANLRNGTLTTPTVGGFRNGRAEFFGLDSLDGKPVFVRFVIACPATERADSSSRSRTTAEGPGKRTGSRPIRASRARRSTRASTACAATTSPDYP